jgi:hypothetical protein
MTIIISRLDKPDEYGFWWYWGVSKNIRFGYLNICYIPRPHDAAIWCLYQSIENPREFPEWP